MKYIVAFFLFCFWLSGVIFWSSVSYWADESKGKLDEWVKVIFWPVWMVIEGINLRRKQKAAAGQERK